MLYKQIDFSVLCSDELKIFCIGGISTKEGIISYSNTALRPKNSVYDISTDTWSLLPNIDFPDDPNAQKHY